MKLCTSPNCTNKVKNSYTYCYDCNNKNKDDKKDDNISVDSGSETIYKKESIPKTLRNCLWINYFDNKRSGKCRCCLREEISIDNYHVGHIIAEINGGKTSLENLIPLCMLCNTSIQRQNVYEFIKKYNIHHGVKKTICLTKEEIEEEKQMKEELIDEWRGVERN